MSLKMFLIITTIIQSSSASVGILQALSVTGAISFGLALPVMADWSYSDLKIAPCRYSGSLFRSDLVICAHNYARHFSPIKNLNVGARVEFVDMDRRLWGFEASEIQILQPTEVEKLVTTPDEDGEPEWDLTLFTCTWGGANRVTIRCDRIMEDKR